MNDFVRVRELSEEACEFMLNFKADDYADGRYDLNEDGLFVNIMTYTTKLREEQKYEAHKKYIDVQYIIEGEEGFYLKDVSQMKEEDLLNAYDEESDIMFFANTVEGDYHVLKGGQFLIMEPSCAHMPGVAPGEPAHVRKMVVKIPVK